MHKEWLIEKGPHDPYIAMITPKMFQRNTLLQLKVSISLLVIFFVHMLDSTKMNEPLKIYISDF